MRKSLVGAFILLCVVGCPGGLPDPANETISFNVSNGVSRDADGNVDFTINIVNVIIRNNQTGESETFTLPGDPIVPSETRGFCCYIPGIYTVTARDSLGREGAASNILTGEGIKLVELTVRENLTSGQLSISSKVRDAPS